MGHEVYAGTWEIAGKSGMNKSIARFPDVCMSPPSPPAGPIPVPYPDTSFSSALKEGSKTVKLGGQPAALAQQSYYKPSVLGDEAATRTFGANVVTHVITGKTYFQAWSMDVKIEGKNVCRHLDITTSNHASGGTTTAPVMSVEALAAAEALIKEGKCPCCEQDLHPNQVDEKGDPYPLIDEGDYYKKRGEQAEATMKSKLDSIDATDIPAGMPYTKDPDKLKFVREASAKQLQDVKDARTTLANARSISPPCENVHPKDEKCGAHFDMSRTLRSLAPEGTDEKKKKNVVREDVLGFTDPVKKRCRDLWRAKGKTIGKSSPVNHMTPLSAGGCPTSQKNLIPSDALPPECLKVNDAQTKLQEVVEKAW